MLPMIEALRARDLASLRDLVASDPKTAKKPQVVVEAARLADLSALEVLLKAGADPNAIHRGYRPLHAVIQEEPHAATTRAPAERLAFLSYLCKHGADPELAGAWPPARALIIAAFVGSRDYADRLVEHGARTDGFTACATGDVAAVKRALGKDAALARARDEGGLTALQCCAGSRLGANDTKFRARLVEIASLLLDAGADPNAKTRSWSHDVDVAYFAAAAVHPKMLATLFERGADATEALPSAAWKDSPELMELCIAHGAVADRGISGGRPLVNDLIRWGQFKPALWLLDHGASPNIADERGWTALHQAASRGNERALKAVLAAGADRQVKDRERLTALDVARETGRTKLVAILSERSG